MGIFVYIIPLLIVFYVGYFFYRKKAGGNAFGTMGHGVGLSGDDVYKKHWEGFNYHGPLMPGSETAMAEKVVVQATALTLGGYARWLPRLTNWVFTEDNTLVITEQREGGLQPREIYRFLTDGERPKIRYATPDLDPSDEDFKNGPKSATGMFQEEPTALLHITINGEEPFYMWCYPEGAEAVIAWSKGTDYSG